MYFHRTVRDRTATVWRQCSVALTLTVGVVGLMLRGVRLLNQICIKKRTQFFNLAKKFVKRTVR